MGKRKVISFKIVGNNLSEAAEELAGLCSLSGDGTLTEEALRIGLLHAYHHLNFAWNIRHVPIAEYKALTQEQFEKWGRYPTEIENL